MSRQITVDIVGDASKFTKATKQAQSTAQKFGNSMKTGLGIGAGIGAFGLLSTAISGAVDFLGDAVKAGMEEQVSIQRLTSSLKANIPAWHGRTAAIEKVFQAQMDLGFSDDEQRDSLARLVAATHDVTKAQNIQRVAMDLARFKGISLADASEALTKVEAGSYRILKSLGIVLKDNATQTEALAAVTKVASGQAEDYANTTAGKLTVAQVKFGEVMDRLGTAILPVVTTGLELVTGALNLLEPTADTATESFVAMSEGAGRFNWRVAQMGDLTATATSRTMTFTGKIEQLQDVTDHTGNINDFADAIMGIKNAAAEAATKVYKLSTISDTMLSIFGRVEAIYPLLINIGQTWGELPKPKKKKKKKAAGGSGEGMTWVGEQGPELVDLPRGSYVHTASQSRMMGGGGGLTVHVHGSIFGVSGVDEFAAMLASRMRLQGA